MRDKVDLAYTFEKNTLEVFELRAHWKNPEEKTKVSIAKVRYVKTQNVWKLYWMRASGKWEAYPEMPEASHLKTRLETIDEDRKHCFWG